MSTEPRHSATDKFCHHGPLTPKPRKTPAMCEERETIKTQIREARAVADRARTCGDWHAVTMIERRLAALVRREHDLGDSGPANVEKPSPVVGSSAWVGDGDARRAEKAVAGALRSCIAAHGPITLNNIGSAVKRIMGAATVTPRAEDDSSPTAKSSDSRP